MKFSLGVNKYGMSRINQHFSVFITVDYFVANKAALLITKTTVNTPETYQTYQRANNIIIKFSFF